MKQAPADTNSNSNNKTYAVIARNVNIFGKLWKTRNDDSLAVGEFVRNRPRTRVGQFIYL